MPLYRTLEDICTRFVFRCVLVLVYISNDTLSNIYCHIACTIHKAGFRGAHIYPIIQRGYVTGTELPKSIYFIPYQYIYMMDPKSFLNMTKYHNCPETHIKIKQRRNRIDKSVCLHCYISVEAMLSTIA